MTTRRRKTTPNLPHSLTVTLPNGKALSEGQEFSVKGQGRYVMRYLFQPDGSITAYGPVGSQQAQWRSFKPEAVSMVHRKAKARPKGI